jgi:hypothetical protein
MTQNRPQTGEYARYYQKYIALAPGGDFLEILESQFAQHERDSQGDLRYAPGKWSIEETLGHVNDAERIFSYRMLRTARGDQAPLAGFEQDDYMKPEILTCACSPTCLRSSTGTASLVCSRGGRSRC